jgi:sarcosine oxidase subunit beta
MVRLAPQRLDLRTISAVSDVAIVGAGIVGLATALELADRGVARVVVYDRAGIGAGASGVQTGGVRQQWSTRVNCAMARESTAFYDQIGERLRPRVDPGFRRCGYLFVAEHAATLDRLEADVATQNAAGVPSRLVSPGEAAQLVPGLRVDDVAGASFCAEDGFFDRPQGVVEAYAEAAQRAGVEVVIGEVRRLEAVGGRWSLSLADGTSADAAAVVVAAATGTTGLLGPLGVDLPIVGEDRWLFYSEPVPERLLEPLVVAVDRHFAAKQLADGRVLASDLAARGDAAGREAWRGRVREGIAGLLPRLELVELPHLVHGIYDVTPDHQAIVGRVTGSDGLFVAAGFSGHGFMMAPAIGRGVAAMVTGEDPGELFAELRPERFGERTLAAETAVV